MNAGSGGPADALSAGPQRSLSFLSRGRVERYRWTLVFALTGVAGILLRVFMYRSATAIPNSDEAVDGLMVRHFVHGHLAVFVWDRSYGGTQELLLAVPWFAIAGSSWFALRIVPDVLSFSR